jgi:predicted protein tyrosine phosphatase
MQSERINVLFVCSRNQWRSPTAERIWRSHPGLSVRSAGTSRTAMHHVSENDLRWCQVIFVMEERHKSRLLAEHSAALEHKPIHVLDIPDQYEFMDPEPVEQLKASWGESLAWRSDTVCAICSLAPNPLSSGLPPSKLRLFRPPLMSNVG